jgi:multiple sugar transport system ATP-binding protein
MATVELKEVTKVYPGNVTAVYPTDLSIADGEFVVLVGPSGCGKSTTLRMVAGLEEISSGELTIDGRTVNEVPARDRDIAMVFQNYALYPHLSVRENLAFPLERRRQHKLGLRGLFSPSYRQARARESEAIAARIASAAQMLGIEALLKRLPRELSGGQRQRVALGRALVRNPKVFLFDEPLSNLDAKLRLEMRSELRALHRRLGATMLYVTHDQEEAMTLGDRLVVMKDGRVQQCGSPTTVYERPANRFVAGFVGTPSMNFIPGRIENGSFSTPEFQLQVPLPRWRAASRELENRELVLGIRPERLSLQASGSGPVGSVESVERYGDRTDVALSLGAVRVIARLANDATPAERFLKAGARLSLSVGRSGLHLFEPGENGARLALADET